MTSVKCSPEMIIFPPIEAVHSGPMVTDFPTNKADNLAYEKAQEVLRRSASAQGLSMTEYPDWVMKKVKKVYLKDVGVSKRRRSSRIFKQRSSNRQRGVFTKKKFKKGELVVPYEGVFIDQKTFEKRYPLQHKGLEIDVPIEAVRPDYSGTKNKKWVVIAQTDNTIQEDIANLRGTNLGFANQARTHYHIKLDGFREAQHTLNLDPSNLIDSEVSVTQSKNIAPLEKGHTYVMGMGSFVNSVEKLFQQEQDGGSAKNPNATFYICRSAKKAVIVTTEEIQKNEEVLVESYSQAHYFKTEQMMWNAIKC